MENKELVRLTAEVKYNDVDTPDSKVSIESETSGPSAEEMCQMFFTTMVGLTFYPETIYKGMVMFLKDKAPEAIEKYSTSNVD